MDWMVDVRQWCVQSAGCAIVRWGLSDKKKLIGPLHDCPGHVHCNHEGRKISSFRWFHLLVLTGSFHWFCPLVVSTGSACWLCLLVPSLVPSAGSVACSILWFHPLILFQCLLHPLVPLLAPSTGSICWLFHRHPQVVVPHAIVSLSDKKYTKKIQKIQKN